MNKKLSGAQMVLVPINRLGQNKFPFVENIKRRYIKYIDFYPATYLPGTSVAGTTSTTNMFVTIYNSVGNTQLMRDLPLERFNYKQTLGVRQQVGSYISLSDCYVNCQNQAMVGTMAAFIFWYDLPEFSERNTTDSTCIDFVSIPLTNSTRYNLFPDDDKMVGKRFRRIYASAPSKTPDYRNGVESSEMENLYLTLRKGSYNVLENVPVAMLDQLKMLEKSEFQNIIFDFNSSYITIGGAGTIQNVQTDYIGKSVFLNLEYANI